MCPMCGALDLTVVPRNALFLAETGGNRFSLSEVLAYGCGNGHMFITLSEENPAVENSWKDAVV
jgi:hypothetical protein